MDALRRTSEVAWRVLVVAAAVVLAAGLLWRLRIVVLPVFVALLACSVLAPLVTGLERRGWRPAVATATVFFGAVLAAVLVLALVIPPTVDQLATTGDAIERGLDDVEDWLVNGPLDLHRSEVRDYTRDPGGKLAELAQESSSTITAGLVVVGETLAGALLAAVLTFLFLKDGRRMQAWALDHVPRGRHEVVRDCAAAAWSALGGFLRGAALLGAVEAVIIGGAVWLVGAPLALPVAVFTFAGAFFPIVGAIAAGALAVVVTLATVGLTKTLIVLAVVIVVQQLDGDLLAPLIYGRSLQLHPVVVLVALSAGGVLGGIVGAFLAVPLAGAAVGIGGVLWARRAEPPDDRPDESAPDAVVGAEPS